MVFKRRSTHAKNTEPGKGKVALLSHWRPKCSTSRLMATQRQPGTLPAPHHLRTQQCTIPPRVLYSQVCLAPRHSQTHAKQHSAKSPHVLTGTACTAGGACTSDNQGVEVPLDQRWRMDRLTSSWRRALPICDSFEDEFIAVRDLPCEHVPPSPSDF